MGFWPSAAGAAGKSGGASSAPLEPIVIPTAPPLDDPRTIPFPVFGGAPAAGIGRGSAAISGVPAEIDLTAAMNIAVARSPVLASARQDYELARVNVAATALPALPNAALQYQRVQIARQDTASIPIVTRTDPTRDHPFGQIVTRGFITPTLSAAQSNLTAFLTQLVYDGGKTGLQIRSAYRSQVAQADTYRRSLQDVVFNATTAYYNALVAQRTMLVDVALVKQFRDIEDLCKAAIAAGKADPSDLASIEVQTLQQQYFTVKAQIAALTAQAAFANAIGLAGNADVFPADDAPQSDAVDGMHVLDVPSYQTAAARALLLRPDYLAGTKNAEAAWLGLRAAKKSLYPQITGTLSSADFSTNDNSGVFRNNASVSAFAQLPIFDGGNAAVNRGTAQASYDKAMADVATVRLQVQSDVQTAVLTLAGSRAALATAHKQVRKAGEEMALRRQLYRRGDAQISDILDAQTTYADALTQETAAIYDVRQAEQAYSYAVGEKPY